MTTPDRKRGQPLPPFYGHELPLPSDMANSRRDLVRDLEIFWMLARRRGGVPKEDQARLIDRFFASLSEGDQEWLEGDDPRWGRPRAVLVKERSLQLWQRGDLGLLTQAGIEDGTTIGDWINEFEKKKKEEEEKKKK